MKSEWLGFGPSNAERDRDRERDGGRGECKLHKALESSGVLFGVAGPEFQLATSVEVTSAPRALSLLALRSRDGMPSPARVSGELWASWMRWIFSVRPSEPSPTHPGPALCPAADPYGPPRWGSWHSASRRSEGGRRGARNTPASPERKFTHHTSGSREVTVRPCWGLGFPPD